MIASKIASIFRNGSRTYFYSSIFFPADVRDDVFRLYAFVRVADDFVDQIPQDVAGFDALVDRYSRALAGETTGDEVVDGFVELSDRKGFDPAWTESFLSAMRQDLTCRQYESVSDVEEYMYGSAEVIGLYMARLLELPDESHPTAQRLGTAMQYMNFLRDVDEDRELGRTYLPQSVLRAFGLSAPSRAEATANPGRFAAMMRHEVRRYERWQAEAECGYRYLPARYRIPIKTAADMYNWTASEIARDPMLVFERKVKPSAPKIVFRLVQNAIATATPAAVSDSRLVEWTRAAGSGCVNAVRRSAG